MNNPTGIDSDYLTGPRPTREIFKKAIKSYKKMGFNGVMLGGYSEDFYAENIKYIAKVLTAEGLPCFQLHAPTSHPGGNFYPYQTRNALGCYRRWIDYALAVNSEILITHLDGWKNIFNRKEGREASKRNILFLKRLLSELRGINITIALENDPVTELLMEEGPKEGFGFYVRELIEVIKGVGSKKLKICLDSGHCMGSGVKPEEEILASGKYLVTTHLSDVRSLLEDHHILPGKGIINWKAVKAAFEKINFSGHFILEIQPYDRGRLVKEWQEKIKLLTQCKDFMRRSGFDCF